VTHLKTLQACPGHQRINRCGKERELYRKT
jgi:hypothetical protein